MCEKRNTSRNEELLKLNAKREQYLPNHLHKYPDRLRVESVRSIEMNEIRKAAQISRNDRVTKHGKNSKP